MTLVIPPYVFHKKKVYKNGRVSFICGGCQRLDDLRYAWAEKSQQDGKETFKLKSWPEEHSCCPTSNAHLVREFRAALYAEVHANPTKPVPSIYDQVLDMFTKVMSAEDKLAFINEAPSAR